MTKNIKALLPLRRYHITHVLKVAVPIRQVGLQRESN